MKALLHVHASLNSSYSPYSILEFPEGTDEDQLQSLAIKFLPSLYGDEETVFVDEDGVSGTTESVGISRTYVSLVKKTRRT